MKVVRGNNLFTVSGLLTPAECESLIARGEAIGFQHAAVLTRSGHQMRPDIRDNDRVQFTDPDLSADLWRRCELYVPHEFERGTAVGFDENFRFYRYDVGQRFNRHKDGVVERTPTVRTRLTCLFYLNDGFEGGETAFYSNVAIEGVRAEEAIVVPQVGDALFFQHEWWHEGRALITGRKYVLRSDVFYRFPVASGDD
jgi:predicted 2-oxoglutarate/Fe(II)-dependent dioxygenase YbiX